MMVQKLGASLGDPGYSLRSSFGEGSDLNFLIKKQAARVKTKATKKAGMNDWLSNLCQVEKDPATGYENYWKLMFA